MKHVMTCTAGQTVMEIRQAMSPEDIHTFGVDIVRDWMEQEGFRILGVCWLPHYNPQIYAHREGQFYHVVVRTGIHPHRGTLGNEEGLACVEHASKFNALCCYAGLTLIHAEDISPGDSGPPKRGDGFYVNFEGLKVMTALPFLARAS